MKNGRLKGVMIVAAIISAIIWIASVIAELREAKQSIKEKLDRAEFQVAKLNASIEYMEGLGLYGEVTVIDTVVETKIIRVHELDTVTVLDTVEVTKRLKYVEFDTTRTFEWADQSITIRAVGQLYSDPAYSRHNTLMLQPVRWHFAEPEPAPVINIDNIKPKYGVGVVMTDNNLGPYLRLGNFRFGLTSRFDKLRLGAYVGYEALSF